MNMNGDESFKLDTFHFGQFLRGYLDQLVQHVQEKLVSFIHDLRKKNSGWYMTQVGGFTFIELHKMRC